MFNYGSFKLLLLKIFVGILLFSFSLFLFISIFSYNPNDPGVGRFVAKSEVENWPLFGFLAKLGRTIFVSRNRSYSLVQKYKKAP